MIIINNVNKEELHKLIDEIECNSFVYSNIKNILSIYNGDNSKQFIYNNIKEFKESEDD